jgi:hypothetical protein
MSVDAAPDLRSPGSKLERRFIARPEPAPDSPNRNRHRFHLDSAYVATGIGVLVTAGLITLNLLGVKFQSPPRSVEEAARYDTEIRQHRDQLISDITGGQ